MAASVEDQIVTTTHVEDQTASSPADDHMVDATPDEEQIADAEVTNPTEDHVVTNLTEDDSVAKQEEEEEEEHVEEDQIVATTDADDHHVEEEHTVTTTTHVEEVHVEDGHVVITHSEEQVMTTHVEEVQIVTDHGEEEMVTVHVEEDQMGATDHFHNQLGAAHIQDEIGSAHIHDEMVNADGELAIMVTPDDQKMSAYDEEKLLITPYEDKMLTPYEVKTPSSYENNEVANPEVQPNKRRKKKSIVWEHFTIETVSPGCRRACCKQCKQTFAYSTGPKVAGTSHLKRHIDKGTCQERSLSPYTPASRGGGNTGSEAPKRRYRTSSTPPQVMFDADRCRHEIARMVIMHDYPLHMVEHPGFLTFIQNLQPQFNMVSFNTIQGDCVATYLMEKQNLIKFIEGIPGRVCLALDMWTSSQSVGYVFVTGHFIDSDWKLQKRLLNVVMEPYPNSDTAFSHAVAVCLHDWSLENKLFSLTHNQQLSEAALETLRPLLTMKNPLVLDGQLLIGNCIARTFSSIVLDVLDEGKETVRKVRESVKYVKTSDSHDEKFNDLRQHLQVPSDKSLSIDVVTQWNTTYHMLVAASELKEVFSCLDTADPDYKLAPSIDEWKQIETICTYLKLLFDAATILTTTTNPTPITFFHEVWKIQSELARAATSEDPFTSSITKRMLEKVDQYWKNCSLALATAVVMDPRFKMKLVEFSFNKIYGEDSPTYIKIVDDGIHELFHEYVALPLPLTPTYAEDGTSGNFKTDEQGSLLSENGLTDFDVYIMETSNHQMKSELDQYLDESLLPRVQEFDVLGWWKLNKMKYPTLSKMARDIFSIPVSTVPSDSVFGTTVKEMDSYRSALRPETVEALICAKDWMQHGISEASNALVKMEY